MTNIDSILNYAHENRKFICVRLIAPIFVASLFLVAFVYSVAWQGAAKPAGVSEMQPHQAAGSATSFVRN